VSARDPRDIADVFAREPAPVNRYPFLQPMEIIPGSLEARAVCGGFEIHFSVRPADPCGGRKEGHEPIDGRPEMDPQPVR
jgi:hypothetical protein